MPNIASHNGIAVANIASINGQDVPSGGGGAFDPVADTGTYTETVPTTGLIHYGHAGLGIIAADTDDNPGSWMNLSANTNTPVKLNLSSDKDGFFQIFAVSNANKSWTKIDCSSYSWAGIEGGRLWMLGSNSSNTHQSSNATTLTQVTSLSGASDTGWTDVSVGSDFILAINGGKLFAMGQNSDGQLGLGDTSRRYTLTQVGGSGGDTDWYKVSAGDDHSAAIKGASGNRSLWTTGENLDGKCGSGDTSGDDTSWIERVSADASEDWTFVEASYNGTMAIKAGKVFFTGDGSDERFGNNSTSDVTTFTQSGKTDASTFGTNWVTGTLGSKRSWLINSSGEVWFAGDGQVTGSGSGNTTDYKSGYHVKTSGNASNGTTGSYGGSDNFTEIRCVRNQGFGAATYIVAAINNGKLYVHGSQRYNAGATYFIPGDVGLYTSQGTLVNSGQTCEVIAPWKDPNFKSGGVFAYFT
tara:strand:+ start:715 stop:2121 length:1407 start_codon:yes stop_codon:yes gene_type:complete